MLYKDKNIILYKSVDLSLSLYIYIYIFIYIYIHISRKPGFNPTASVGANAASEARKEELSVLPPGPPSSQQAPKLKLFLICGRILPALKRTPKWVPPKVSQNH